jgi:hypothetical protein
MPSESGTRWRNLLQQSVEYSINCLMLDQVSDITSNSTVCVTLGAQIIENYLKFCLEDGDTAGLAITLSSCACVLFLRSCLSYFHAECSRLASDLANQHATQEDSLFESQKCYKGRLWFSGCMGGCTDLPKNVFRPTFNKFKETCVQFSQRTFLNQLCPSGIQVRLLL